MSRPERTTIDDFGWGLPSTMDREAVSNVDDHRDSVVTPAAYYRANWHGVDMSAGARVARGMLYVQRFYPEARDTVNLSLLDVASGSWCILGQVHGFFGDAPEVQHGYASFLHAHGFAPLLDDDIDPETGRWVINTLWCKAFEAWRSR